MKILKIKNINIDNLNLMLQSIIVCWGFFDGIHKGHQKLFKKLLFYSKLNNYQTCVISFNKKPQSIINNEDNKILLNYKDKIEIISKYNFNYYLEIKFTKQFAKILPEEFIFWLLKNNVKAVVVNPNIKFGYQEQGNIETLKKSSLKVYFCNDEFINKKKISSTYIKQLLWNKKINIANTCLQQFPYTICGKVVKGLKKSRNINFPTANLLLLNNYALPGFATYITITKVNQFWYRSMTVIILRNNKILIETHLLNFNQNLYGKIIKISFLDFLRNNLIFINLNDLKKQLYKDLGQTIKYFLNNNIKYLDLK